MDRIQHKLSSGDLSNGGVLGPAAHPQLSAPTSIFRVAVLLGWVDRPVSSKATGLRSPEQGPYSTAQLPCSWPGALATAKSKQANKQKHTFPKTMY